MQRTLKGLRYDLSLTQKEMADKLEVSLASYQRYERYEVEAPMSMIIKLADMCKIENVREIKIV